MAIQDRNLNVGTKLFARYKGQTHTAELVEKEGAKLYRLSDGREFKSPSAAGTAITGKACNGWAFWTVGDGSEATKPAKSKDAEPASKITPVPKPRDQAPRAQEPDGRNASRGRRAGWQRGARRRAPSRPGRRPASAMRRVWGDVPQRRLRDGALLRDARQDEGDEPTA